MPAIKIIKRTVELGGNMMPSSFPDPIPASFFTDEIAAHMFVISARQDGQPLSFAGTDVVSACFLNDNNQTVLLSGYVQSGVACVVLSDACYHVPGSFTFTISVSGAVVYECRGTIKLRSSDTAYDPTGEISVARIEAAVAELNAAIAEAEAKGEEVLASIPDDYETLSEEADWLGFDIISADGITVSKLFDVGGSERFGYDTIFLFSNRFINGIKSLKVCTAAANVDIKLLLLKKQGNDYVIVDERTKNAGANTYVDFGSVYVSGEYYAAIQGLWVYRRDAGVTNGYTCSANDIVDNKLTNLTPNTQIAPVVDLVFFQSGEIDPDLFDGTDTEKLQKAFDLCEVNGGTIVVRRKYLPTDIIVIRHSYTSTNRIIVHGDSISSEIRTDAFFGFAGVSGVTGGVVFRDLKFSCIDPVNNTGGLLNGGIDANTDDTLVNIIFENCYFYNLKYIYFSNPRYVQSLWFIGCIIRIAGTMIYTGGGPWYNTIIRNCIIEDNSAIGSISWGEGVSIRDNVIEGNTYITAVDVSQGAYSVSIENNYFEANNRDITLSLTQVNDQTNRTVRIVGNFFASTITAPITLPQAASTVYGGVIVIESNKFLASSDQQKAQYMIYGTSGQKYSEVLCAYNSGNITALTSDKLSVLTSTDLQKAVDAADDVGELKSAINFNNLCVHDTGNEISTKDGFWVGDYGALNTSTARGYLIIPLENIYINGVATLKSGRLGFYQTTVFAMAYLDKDFHIISAIYQDIIAPHTFSSNDIPSGTVYVAFNSYSTANPHVMATFAFQSTDTKLGTVSDKIKDVYEATTQYACSEVSLTYEAATGYYASNKSFNTFSGVTVTKVSVTEGQKYLLTTRNYYNAAIACLLDANDAVDSVIYVANNINPVEDYEITIPGNVSKLMIQRFYTYEPTKIKLITGIKAKGVKSLLNGKRVTVIGDSITERNSRAKTNWALWLTDWCGAVIQNLGASGTGFIAGGPSSYSNRIASISNPDIIGVAVSFNDMSNTIEDLTTAAESFFDDLITAYPTTPIICYVQSPWSAYHYGVEKSDQWIAAVKDICATRGVPFYSDMYNGTVLKPWIAANRAVYYINDGEGSTGEEDWVHPNSEGHKAIARYLYPKFAENLVAVGLDYGID